MANFKIMRNGLNTEIVGDPHIGQSSEDVTVTVTDDGTYTGYEKKLYYSYGYRNQIYRAIADENSSGEFIIPMTAFLEPGIVKLSLELSNGTNKPTCNAYFIIATDGAKSVTASDILPDDATWEKYVESYVKSHADTLKGEKGDTGPQGEKGDTGTGFSTEVINKLEEVGSYLAYTTADGGSKWKELISILRGSSGGGSGETGVTLSNISATYTGGEVTTGTALSNLTGITVTATYSDGTTKTVTGYSLSGEILEGENTITVSYGGRTTTFMVTGVASGGEETGVSNETEWTDGVAYTFDWVTDEYVGNVSNQGAFKIYNGWNRSPYLYCEGTSTLDIHNPFASSNGYNAFYDADKNYISSFSVNVTPIAGDVITIEVPKNAVYFSVSYDASKTSAPGLPYTITPKA